MMTLEDFEKNIDLYSADLSRWPESQIRAAVELRKAKPEAKQLLEKHVSFDDVLRAYVPKEPNVSALEVRIMAEVARTKQGVRAADVSGPAKSGFNWRPLWLFAPGGGLAVAALLGFLVGFQPQQHKDTLLDPAYYTESQLIHSDADDADAYDGGL